MDIKEFILFCINDRITKARGSLKQIHVFVDVRKKFVQVNGVFFTPDEVTTSHGIFVNLDVMVTGWESINKENLKNYIKRIDGLEVVYSCNTEN